MSNIQGPSNNSFFYYRSNVLTERFCQDDVEKYFGYQRTQGRRSDNPTTAEFGYNDLRIATLRDSEPTAEGNVAGRHAGKRNKWYAVSE